MTVSFADVPQSTPQRSLVVVGYAVCGALAVGLRFWGIAFSAGVPRGRVDEELFVLAALRMFDGSLNPGYFTTGFPEGFFLALHGLIRIYARIVNGWFGQDVNLGCRFAFNPIRLLIAGRALSAALGSL